MMSETPFFSVVVPVYNKEPHIARAINSVLNQTYQNFELVIVCDPSTDNSNVEVEKFTDPRIRVFYRDEPGPGGYATRNLGIKEAKAKWVAFLDADDEWYEHHLQKVKEVIDDVKDVHFISSARSSEAKGVINPDQFAKQQTNKKAVFIGFEEYLKHAVKGMRAVGTNSAVIDKSRLSDFHFFPEGRAHRSGDLYAWVVQIQKAGGLYWSPHIASIAYRDSVNMVSRNSIPSISLNHEMVTELSPLVNSSELVFLKKYANRLVRIAWIESRKAGVNAGMLSSHLYWRHDIYFCLMYSTLSLMPSSILSGLKEMRRAFMGERLHD